MTIEESKTAYFSEEPVIYDGIEYERISALIYKKPKGEKSYLALELYDKCKHCVVIALPEKVKLKGGEEGCQE